ncbi:complexin-2 [Poecilia latipinna]|uniref:complexin-2 n=1 Tax=Poecilia latipinna TaxID=48699 RepID=UPI00072E83F6|nr:PREDICTED: complexin-1 [Poecilia latipinna]
MVSAGRRGDAAGHVSRRSSLEELLDKSGKTEEQQKEETPRDGESSVKTPAPSRHQDKYGIKKKEEKEAEAAAAMEQASEGSLTRPKKAVPTGCGDEEEEESIVDTVMKFIPAPLMDMFNKK